jgi:uncharacterized protein (DUF2141 family)
MISKSIFVILLLTFLVVPSHSAQHSVTLHINVSGATPSKGHIILSLFSSADNYLKSPILSKTNSVNSAGMADFELSDLLPGVYALNAIYDEDSNGKLNTSLFGIPTELVGFSNNAKGYFGPPKFDKVVFEALTSQQISIRLGNAQN